MTITQFENLSQQEKDDYILLLLSLQEEERTGVDKHILKFNSVRINYLQISEIEE